MLVYCKVILVELHINGAVPINAHVERLLTLCPVHNEEFTSSFTDLTFIKSNVHGLTINQSNSSSPDPRDVMIISLMV